MSTYAGRDPDAKQARMEPDLSEIPKLRQQAVQRCGEEIRVILEKYKCQLVPQILIEGGQIRSNVVVNYIGS